jgi:hypothetical protein
MNELHATVEWVIWGDAVRCLLQLSCIIAGVLYYLTAVCSIHCWATLNLRAEIISSGIKALQLG